MNKQIFIDFIKKYPMSILLAIIAINLYSIGGSLKTEQDLNRLKLTCIKYKQGHIDPLKFGNKINMAKKLKIMTTATEVCNAVLGS